MSAARLALLVLVLGACKAAPRAGASVADAGPLPDAPAPREPAHGSRERAGTVRQSFTIPGETLATPPAIAEDGSVWIATEKGIYAAR